MALINYLARIQFEFGAIATLKEEASRLGLQRPMIVTDRGVESAGVFSRAVSALGEIEFEAYLDTPPNPTEASVYECLAFYKKRGCDGLIALGGGSPIDLAKGVALLATHGGEIGDYGILTGGSERIGHIAPLIAIPTTAGTGAEVGRAAVITLESGRKIAAVNLNLVPAVVICDPELTLTMPAKITAATGMDALTHGIEAFLSPLYNPPAEAIALDCIGRIAAAIERATSDGSDREARKEMMMGALEGGMILQKGLGAAHAMATPLGEYHLHHGTLNAVVLPAVLRFNAHAAPEKFSAIRKAMKLNDGVDLGDWVQRLNERLGMPAGLGAMGVPESDIPEIALKASKDHLSKTNPRPVSAGDYENLLRAAF